jgi:hypothetical protein
MRSVLALGLLITLCASANAATVHHSKPRHVIVRPSQGPPSTGPPVRAGGFFVFAPEHELKPNLMVSADCEPTSASRIRCSSESSTMDCHDSKLNGTVFGIHDWLNYLRDQAATYRKLVERADDPFVKTELLALASVCEEIADNIEDHLTGDEDHAPRGPLSRLS